MSNNIVHIVRCKKPYRCLKCGLCKGAAEILKDFIQRLFCLVKRHHRVARRRKDYEEKKFGSFIISSNYDSDNA